MTPAMHQQSSEAGRDRPLPKPWLAPAPSQRCRTEIQVPVVQGLRGDKKLRLPTAGTDLHHEALNTARTAPRQRAKHRNGTGCTNFEHHTVLDWCIDRTAAGSCDAPMRRAPDICPLRGSHQRTAPEGEEAGNAKTWHFPYVGMNIANAQLDY